MRWRNLWGRHDKYEGTVRPDGALEGLPLQEILGGRFKWARMPVSVFVKMVRLFRRYYGEERMCACVYARELEACMLLVWLMDTTSREGRLQTSCRRYREKISLGDVYKEKEKERDVRGRRTAQEERRQRGAQEKGKGKKKEIKRLFTDQ